MKTLAYWISAPPELASHGFVNNSHRLSGLVIGTSKFATGNKRNSHGREVGGTYRVILDDRLLSVPFINFQEAPDGIDGATGSQIQGGLSGERARQIAAILDSGPMPASLVPQAP